MKQSRWKIGIVTLGVTLIALGILLILPLFTTVDSWMALRFWPLILISMGIEIIAYMLFCKEENKRLQFSGGSITLLIILTIFCGIISGAYVAADYFGINKDDFYFGTWIDSWEFTNGRTYETETKTVDFSGKAMDLNLRATNVVAKRATDGKMTARITVNTHSGSVSAADALAQVKTTDHSITTGEGKTGRISYEVELFLPEGVPLKLEATASHLDFQGLVSEITIKLSACELYTKDCKGNMTITATASEMEIKEQDGNIAANVSVGQFDVYGITGVITGSLGVGDYEIEPKYTLKKGWVLSVSEGRLEFNVPNSAEGAIEIDGRTSGIDTDEFEELIERNALDVSFKAPTNQEVAVKITARNANISLDGMENYK